MLQHTLLQLATRIHHALMREIGSGIDIGAMLREQRYASEILYLCRACEDPALRTLGECFETLAQEVRQKAPRSGRRPFITDDLPHGPHRTLVRRSLRKSARPTEDMPPSSGSARSVRATGGTQTH